MKTSLVFLVAGLALGAYILVAQFIAGSYPPRLFVTAHAHLLLVGFMLMIVMGVATWMFPVALIGLALTALLGTLMGAGKVWPALTSALFPTLHAHVQLALMGWVLPMVIGVAAHVYPMFLLAPAPGPLSRRLQQGGITLGTPALVGAGPR